MRPALLCALIVVAFAGCSPQTGFSQLGDFQLRFLDNSGMMMASFSYDTAAQGCRTLGEDSAATANGERISLFPGEAVTNFFPPRTDCITPELMFDRPGRIDMAVTLVASSGGEEMDVDIEGLGANVPGTIVLAPGGTISAGDRIQVALGAGFERVRWSQLIGQHVTDSGGWAHFLSLSPPSPSGVLDVQLPDDLPAGHALLRVFAPVDPIFTRCLGPMACSWDTSLLPRASLEVAFDVAP